MSNQIRIRHIRWFDDGILFADPSAVVDLWPEFLSVISKWRPTIGGKLVGVFAGCAPMISSRRWEWPVVPLTLHITGDDTWVTGTVSAMPLDRIKQLITPETDRRQPRYDANGQRISRASRKVAHRVIWCDRKRSVLVTDPLCRVTFTNLEEALAYIERRNGSVL